MGHSGDKSLGTAGIENKQKAARCESGWELRNAITESHRVCTQVNIIMVPTSYKGNCSGSVESQSKDTGGCSPSLAQTQRLKAESNVSDRVTTHSDTDTSMRMHSKGV